MLDWLYRKLWANRLRKIVTVGCAAALVAVGTVVGPAAVQRLNRCAEGVYESDGECIGVNGTGYDFDTPLIHGVTQAIAKENARIADRPHVTVAMMLPLQPDRPAEAQQLLSDLQGAHLAQYQANRQQELPLLRLVLANPGNRYRQQQKVVDRLAEMAHSPRDNLRAVTGFNLSLKNTLRAVDRLTNDLGIPVLASRISSDGIANKDGEDRRRFETLARIIPTNGQQADALANYYGRQKDLQNAETVVVEDTRPHDLYVRSLAEAFSKRKEPGPPGPKSQPFTSPSIDKVGNTGNQFTSISNIICTSTADTVYFAGRPLHLKVFITKLAATSCSGKHYTVVSGSGAASLNRYMKPDDWAALQGENPGEPLVTVQYAAPAHPDAWKTTLQRWRDKHPSAEKDPAYLTEPADALQELHKLIEAQGDKIGEVQLENSRTMLVYDGVRTIAEAIFMANSDMQDAVDIPSSAEVAAQWPYLDSQQRVAGTSGWICLTNAGNPYDKPVAVVELDPTSRHLTFVDLAWPDHGQPQPEDCVVPSDTDQTS